MEQKNTAIIDKKQKINLFLANPRGFCAGVERAISIVEKALSKFGPPIYIKHEIVHNKFVVENLKQKGAVFVEDIADIPDNALTIYSAHGVSVKVERESKDKQLKIFDATCPLVKKVHNQVVNLNRSRKVIIMVGHAGHPEVVGTSGRIADKIYLVQNIQEAKEIDIPETDNLSYVTQTTLSVDDTKDIIEILKQRYPAIESPKKDDICYATQNRQDAVKELTREIDLLLVIGSQNSSNSNRLCDIGKDHNIASFLIANESEIDLNWFSSIHNVGLTAGASAPEILLNKVIKFLQQNFLVNLIEKDGKKENIMFNLPKELRGSNE